MNAKLAAPVPFQVTKTVLTGFEIGINIVNFPYLSET